MTRRLRPALTHARLAVLVVGALATALTLPACAPKTVVTPQGQAAYSADQVLHVVAALQQSAIDANTQHQLADAQSVQIVRVCVDIEQTLKATPSGWQTTVRTAWSALKTALAPTATQTLLAAIAAVDAAMAAIGG